MIASNRTASAVLLVALGCIAASACSTNAPRRLEPVAQQREVATVGLWSLVTPTSSPPGRLWAASAYDSQSERLVLFGGSDVSDRLSDTWAYFRNGNQTEWNQICGGGTPCPISKRRAAAMGYHPPNDTLVLFGGQDLTAPIAETWVLSGNTWSAACGSGCTEPTRRRDAAMAYFPGISRTIMFGGHGFSGAEVGNETLAWDGSSWSTINMGACSVTGPAAREQHAMVYDAARGVVVLFGGDLNVGGIVGDTWEFDGTCWEQKCTTAPCSTNAPPALAQPAMGYSPVRERVILHGGLDSTVHVDARTWEWDGSSWTLTDTGSGPAVHSAAYGYHAALEQFVVFGGQEDSGAVASDTSHYLARGNTCNGPNQCESAACVDGVCCTTSSCGDCATCNGTDPGVCTALADGTTISACAPYRCDGSSQNCPSSCGVDADCASNHYCGGGSCVPDESLGESCTRNAQCPGNTNCVDGVCCDGPCAGSCRACTNAIKGAGADGTCGFIVLGQDDPTGDECAAGGSPCEAPGYCDGAGSCVPFAPNTTTCGAGTTCSGNQVVGSLCDGAGTCVTSSIGVACDPYLCVSDACSTSCANDSECTSGYFCTTGGTCVAKSATGESCGAANECLSDFCVDGVCCTSACAGTCDSCDSTGTCRVDSAGDPGNPSCDPFACDGSSSACPSACSSDTECATGRYCRSSDGTCQPQRGDGEPCTGASQCTSGICVDGRCCDSACSGTCEACDESGSEGTCIAIAGSPHGNRSCGGGSDTECAGSCDGSDRTACTFPMAGTPCGTGSCEQGSARASACNGSGLCAPLQNEECAPYVCGGDTCREDCASNDDCVDGFTCENDSCQPATKSSCSDDGASVVPPDGNDPVSCAPYLCRDGECRDSCTSSADCADGATCDLDRGSGVCLETLESASADDGGGCGCRVAGRRDDSAGWLSVAGLALALSRRRRWRRAPKHDGAA